jgi:carbon storage regulator
MLVLTRKLNERIVIGDSIVLTIAQINGSNVRIGIQAPHDVSIVREELLSEALTPAPRPVAKKPTASNQRV